MSYLTLTAHCHRLEAARRLDGVRRERGVDGRDPRLLRGELDCELVCGRRTSVIVAGVRPSYRLCTAPTRCGFWSESQQALNLQAKLVLPPCTELTNSDSVSAPRSAAVGELCV